MKINQYRKLIAAVVGVVALKLGPDYIPAPEAMTEAIFVIATPFLVWLLPNDPPE